MKSNYNKVAVLTIAFWLLVLLATPNRFNNAAQAANNRARRTTAGHSAHAGAGGGGGGVVYPQFQLMGHANHWIRDQMPVKVWVAPGYTLDGILDGAGVPVTNTSNKDNWPDVVVQVMEHPDQLSNLPTAAVYNDQLRQAAIDGINSWSSFEREGLFNFEIVNNPEDADVFVFWTPHFVNKLGLALFENDIRGYTAVHALPFAPVQQAMQRGDLDLIRRSLKPVVILLRTQEREDGNPMPYARMKAAAAHEFGHALGINDHSPYPGDLMSVNYGRGVISANDAATIRYLYRSAPFYVP